MEHIGPVILRVFNNLISKQEMNMYDENVNNPPHYGGKENTYECIKVIESMGWAKDFCRGNAMKYLMRAEIKGDEDGDLKKAVWYLNKLIDLNKA